MTRERGARAEPGSFRDPAGRVWALGDRIVRTVTARAADDYEFVRRTGALEQLATRGWIVASRELEPTGLGLDDPSVYRVLEHPRLPFISYPYEWCFPALRDAALLHLDLHLDLLERGITLSDASAYNVQFSGPRPVFVDVLSLRRYREGEYWTGHRQFCEQFLNPLLLWALLGVAPNAWYRGTLEGVATEDLARLLPLRRTLSWNVLTHVVLHARLQASAARRAQRDGVAGPRRPLSRAAFRGLLLQLRRWIARLAPAARRTAWAEYAARTPYTSAEETAKRRFLAGFVRETRPGVLWDLGCNTGELAEVALGAGAGTVVGFDFDQRAVEQAYERAHRRGLSLLPLIVDLANPSPDQGWQQAERKGFGGRLGADAVIALAFVHHLVISRNIPLDQALGWLTGLAPAGVVEFVPKSDPTVQWMLALREDIFDRYREEVFTAELERRARVVAAETVSSSGRRLYWYERR